MENAMITMKNINKGYMLGEERLPILKDINFQVNKGEYVAILGPSGSGKTTLMNMIGCMDVMDSGEYYLDGMAIHETKEDDLTMVRNQKIVFIFQNYQLIPTYNVMQNIIMPLLMRGMTHEEAEEKCKILSNCWGWITVSDIGLTNCPADRSREYPLPEHWWDSRRSFWRMSLPVLWIRPAAEKY